LNPYCRFHRAACPRYTTGTILVEQAGADPAASDLASRHSAVELLLVVTPARVELALAG
jgi:hypothetical protein